MNSKTIDGVPRALLMKAANRLSDLGQAPISEPLFAILNAHSAELRALLDAPESCAHEWQSPVISSMPDYCAKCAIDKPAAQPQGEPVGYRDPSQRWATIKADNKAKMEADGHDLSCFSVPLYAKQTAPVARLGVHHVLGAIHNVPGFPGVKGNHIHDLTALLNGVLTEAEQPAPADQGTTSDKYRAELYDEVWQAARALGFGNVTEALDFLAREVGEPYAYEYDFATMLYTSGPGKFKKILTNEAPDQHEIDAGCIINVKPLYSPEQRKYDDTLLPFLALMRKELHANSHKGDRDGWLGMTSGAALSEIDHHRKKLVCAVACSNADAIKEYAADVANCAMMLADVCGVLGRA